MPTTVRLSATILENGTLEIEVPTDATVLYRLPPTRTPQEFVGVALDRKFESPAQAHAFTGQIWTYSADPALKLTIGDRVVLESAGSYRDREGVVVRLNQPDPRGRVGYCFRVIRKVVCV